MGGGDVASTRQGGGAYLGAPLAGLAWRQHLLQPAPRMGVGWDGIAMVWLVVVVVFGVRSPWTFTQAAAHRQAGTQDNSNRVLQHNTSRSCSSHRSGSSEACCSSQRPGSPPAACPPLSTLCSCHLWPPSPSPASPSPSHHSLPLTAPPLSLPLVSTPSPTLLVSLTLSCRLLIGEDRRGRGERGRGSEHARNALATQVERHGGRRQTCRQDDCGRSQQLTTTRAAWLLICYSQDSWH